MKDRQRVRVFCSNCAVVRVRPGDVTLRNCADGDRWDYRFRCPECGQISVEPSDRWLALEALGAGAGLERWHLPLELAEPHDGPPINALDVLEFRLHLSKPGWTSELERAHDASDRRRRRH